MSSAGISVASVVEAHDAPAVVIDRDYRIVAANEAYCRAYGLGIQEVVGHQCHQVSHRSAVPCHLNGEQCPHNEVFSTERPFEVLHTHYDCQAHPDHVRIRAYPLRDAQGNIFLMESIHRLAPTVDLTCEDMQMVGRSPAFLECLEHLAHAARSDAPVLIHGETGVGKELAARFIHEQSLRRGQPYVELNCAAIPEALTESELFGHERGALTGGTRRGLFEQADGGTLFLDEIGEMPPLVQAKLLRVLDSGQFRRVGSETPLSANVRVIAATNQDLLELASRGRFREDLYFRIAAFDIHIPALRDRRRDIQALAEVLVSRMCQHGKRPCRLTRDAIEKLTAYDYPGNVRELRNILQQAIVLSPDGVISARHIRLGSRSPSRARVRMAAMPVSSSQPQRLSELESRHIRELLNAHAGHRRTVAGLLGISERTLYRKLNRYQLR